MLTDLDLTFSQARVYLVLAKANSLTVQEISKSSNIARPDTYRVIAKLQEAGLVEQIIGKPTKYRAIPPDQYLPFMIRHKIDNISKLQQKAQELIRNCKINNKLEFTEGKLQFVVVPKGEVAISKLLKAIDNSHHHICLLTDAKALLQGLPTIDHNILKALKRFVDVRWLTEKIPNNPYFYLKSPKFACYSSFKLKDMPKPPKIRMGIIDEEIFIPTHPNRPFGESNLIWTDNPFFVSAMKEYFDMLWERKHQNTKPHKIIAENI